MLVIQMVGQLMNLCGVYLRMSRTSTDCIMAGKFVLTHLSSASSAEAKS